MVLLPGPSHGRTFAPVTLHPERAAPRSRRALLAGLLAASLAGACGSSGGASPGGAAGSGGSGVSSGGAVASGGGVGSGGSVGSTGGVGTGGAVASGGSLASGGSTTQNGSGGGGGGVGFGSGGTASPADGGGLVDAGRGSDAAGGGGPSDGPGPGDGAVATTDAGGGPAGPFTCTQLVGPSPMGQWFNGGFLKYPGIDATKYQLIMVAHHYSDAWAVPGDSAWNTKPTNPCAQGSTTPDRVSFMVTQWSEKLESQWVADLTGIVKNIQAKWPMVKRIEIMPSTSAPGDVQCPGTTGTETIIPAAGYAAIDSMPARYPGLVVALPHFEVTKCSDFIGNGSAPQYAPDANATSGPAVMDMVGVFGSYYAAHP